MEPLVQVSAGLVAISVEELEFRGRVLGGKCEKDLVHKSQSKAWTSERRGHMRVRESKLLKKNPQWLCLILCHFVCVVKDGSCLDCVVQWLFPSVSTAAGHTVSSSLHLV